MDYMSGVGKIIFAEKADRQMTGNLTRMFLDMEYTCDRWQENESVQAEQTEQSFQEYMNIMSRKN